MLGGTGLFIGMHWGAFRLTDEPPLEPPARMRRVWSDAGFPDCVQSIQDPGHGPNLGS